MTLRLGRLVITVLLCIAAQHASAEDAATQSDISCLMQGTLVLARTTDPTRKLQLEAFMMYYLGRVDGRDPALDWTQAAVAFAADVRQESPQQMRDNLRSCGSALVARGATLKQLGQQLRQMGNTAQ